MSSNHFGEHYPIEINSLFSKAFKLLEPSITKINDVSDTDVEQDLLTVIGLCREFEHIYQNWVGGEDPYETLNLLRTLLSKIEDP